MLRNTSLPPITSSQTSASTSRSLLAGVREREPAAWDRLVALYAPLVYYWCRKMELPEQDMADVFQDVFQSVARKIADFHKHDSHDTFRGWLRTITRNKVYDYFRRELHRPQAAGGTTAWRRLSEFPADAEDCENCDGEASPVNDDQDFGELFRRALEQIARHFEEPTWQAFWRVVVEGKTAQEVAQELDMQPGTVRVAKSRVLHRLRKELGELR
jgi:RNA polymerase sigma-70 factor (ECF subfamily)